MAKPQVDEATIEAKLKEFDTKKSAIEAEEEALRKQLATAKFKIAKELIQKFGAHFTAKQKSDIAEMLGLDGKKAKKEKATTPASQSDKPKKYRLATGEEWGGQGGERMAPPAFKEWRKKTPTAPWPKNPDYA